MEFVEKIDDPKILALFSMKEVFCIIKFS